MNDKDLDALETVASRDNHHLTTSRVKRVINPPVVLIPGSMSLLRLAPARAISRQPSGWLSRERMARAVHAHQRTCPAPAGRTTRTRPRKRNRKARQVSPDHDDIAYVSKDQAETSVLFELIGSRYERLSLLITANQPFGEWGKVFPGEAMTLAAIDRLVHHSTILEMNVESYRRRAAINRKRRPGRPPTHATIKEGTTFAPCACHCFNSHEVHLKGHQPMACRYPRLFKSVLLKLRSLRGGFISNSS
jgi:hypothetical protein